MTSGKIKTEKKDSTYKDLTNFKHGSQLNHNNGKRPVKQEWKQQGSKEECRKKYKRPNHMRSFTLRWEANEGF